MSASNTDKVRQAAPNFATTLSGAILNTDTSLTLASATGLPTSTAITLVIDATDPTTGASTPSLKEVVTGTLSGTTVSNLLRGQDGTSAIGHASGANVVMWITANLWNDFQTAFLQDHKQLGYHGALTDANGNTWLGQTATSSAVNYFNNANAAAGNGPVLSVLGSDPNIDALLRGKGTGSGRFSGYHDGWVDANETPTYASSTTINVAAGTKYQIGDLLQFTQSATAKYFVVTGISSNVLTVSGYAGVTVANSAITAFYYSRERQPTGIGLSGGHAFNPYKFSVYRNAALNSGNGAYALVSYDTKLYDTSSNIDVVTNKGRFTAPVAGFYQFNANISTSVSYSAFAIALFKNGSVLNYGGKLNNTNSVMTGGAVGYNDVVQLAATDYVEIFAFGNAATALDVGAGQTRFSGFLVSGI